LRQDRFVFASPLTGKAMLAKRAFHRAGQEAGALGQDEIRPEHLLLGVLRDAQDLVSSPRLGRRAKRVRAYFGLPQRGPSPVKLLIKACGISLDAVRAEVLALLQRNHLSAGRRRRVPNRTIPERPARLHRRSGYSARRSPPRACGRSQVPPIAWRG